MRRWLGLLLILGFVLLSSRVDAAAVLASIYTSASEAETWSGATNATCQILSPSCSDSQYPSYADVYSSLGDGSTSASSGASMRNSSSSQSQFLKLAYDVDDVRQGKYYLRFFSTGAASTYSGFVHIYLNHTSILPGVNGTVAFTTVANEPWTEVDVTNGTLQMIVANGNRVTYRLGTTGSTVQTVTEVYLKRPFGSSDISFVPTGSSQVELNQKASTVWLAISRYSGVNISDVVCEFEDEANGTLLNLSYSYSVAPPTEAPGKVEIYWVANESLGVKEGMQLSVYCDLKVEGSQFRNLEQIVYVNREKGIFDQLSAWFLKIFNLLQKPVQVYVATEEVGEFNSTVLVVSTITDGVPANVSSNGCKVSVWVQDNQTMVVNRTSMVDRGMGLWSYEFPSSNQAAPYLARVVCEVNDSSGSLMNYSGQGTIGKRSTLVGSDVFEGTPSLDLFQGAGLAGSDSQILVRLSVGSESVVNAECNVTVYYPWNTTKVIDNKMMSYSGDDGVYNYTWTSPAYVVATYPARVLCRGGGLGSLVVQSATGLVIGGGVVMQSVS